MKEAIIFVTRRSLQNLLKDQLMVLAKSESVVRFELVYFIIHKQFGSTNDSIQRTVRVKLIKIFLAGLSKLSFSKPLGKYNLIKDSDQKQYETFPTVNHHNTRQRIECG